MANPTLPTTEILMNPVIQAVKMLGGSGSIEEINHKIIELMSLTDEQLQIIHNPNKGSQGEIEYRLAWARTYLKKYGLLENSARGVWALTPQGRQVDKVNGKEVRISVQGNLRQVRDNQISDDEPTPDMVTTWRDEILATLLKMHPAAFERLVQRLLRESGFIQVEVTGRSGDGGIDGKGIMRLGGLLSFHVIFQCKRYQGAVSSSQVRDFRGAMVGRADKGLLVTTGNFTKDAIYEATRDGAPAIDLIDGDQLINKLKELSLGVKTQWVQVEQVTVEHDWLLNI